MVPKSDADQFPPVYLGELGQGLGSPALGRIR